MSLVSNERERRLGKNKEEGGVGEREETTYNKLQNKIFREYSKTSIYHSRIHRSISMVPE
jgi:hypothetical protein